MNLRLQLLLDHYAGGFLQASLKLPTILLGMLLRRSHDLSACKEIAVLKLLGGGSLVIAYPALVALKELPHVERLILVTSPAIKPFGETLGIFDEIVVIRDTSLGSLAVDSLRAIVRLFRIDAFIDLEIHSKLTTVFSLLTCARNRVGFFTNFAFWRRHLNTHLLFCNIANGIYNFYDQLAEIFGARAKPMAECIARFQREKGAGEPDGRQVRIAMATTCSGLSKERMLRPTDWPEILAARLAPYGNKPAEVHLLGAPGDKAELEELSALLQARLPGITIVNQAGKTKLDESVRLLAGMDEVLCIDSALLHFSRLLGWKVVSYWGPTDPALLLRPFSEARDEVHYRKIACSPCVHLAHRAPCRGNNHCMRLAVDPHAEVPENPPWMFH